MKIKHLNTRWKRFLAWIDMLFVDHGFIRVLYNNFYKVSNNVYRSSQPAPFQVRNYKKKYDVKTIINLRGDNIFGSYLLEKEEAQKQGITFIDFRVYSRDMPKKETILEAKKIFECIKYPINFHCKSGADRAGLMSTLYLILIENVPVEIAIKQLAKKYGHFKEAKTGILDYFFQLYLEYSKTHQISFIDWVTQVYDRDKAISNFQSSWWANKLVDKILKRE